MTGTRAKLFTHGGSQAVRLPKAFRFSGAEVSVRREGEAVVLEPIKDAKPPRTREEVEALWASIDALQGGDTIDYPPEPDPQERPSFS